MRIFLERDPAGQELGFTLAGVIQTFDCGCLQPICRWSPRQGAEGNSGDWPGDPGRSLPHARPPEPARPAPPEPRGSLPPLSLLPPTPHSLHPSGTLSQPSPVTRMRGDLASRARPGRRGSLGGFSKSPRQAELLIRTTGPRGLPPASAPATPSAGPSFSYAPCPVCDRPFLRPLPPPLLVPDFRRAPAAQPGPPPRVRDTQPSGHEPLTHCPAAGCRCRW